MSSRPWGGQPPTRINLSANEPRLRARARGEGRTSPIPCARREREREREDANLCGVGLRAGGFGPRPLASKQASKQERDGEREANVGGSPQSDSRRTPEHAPPMSSCMCSPTDLSLTPAGARPGRGQKKGINARSSSSPPSQTNSTKAIVPTGNVKLMRSGCC